MTVTREDLTRVLAGGSYGFRVRASGDGECTLEVPFRPTFERPGGVVSGPVFGGRPGAHARGPSPRRGCFAAPPLAA